jgi:uracil-DNA glycosylase
MGDPTSQGQIAELAAALRTYVEYQRELGVAGFPRDAAPIVAAPRSETPPVTAAPTPPAAKPATRGAEPSPDLFVSPEVARADSLEALRAAIGDCKRCKLAPCRTNLVFGVGNPKARLAFVGEAPGRDEDVKGEPFVGRAGQLLTEIITKGMRIAREDVYICNVIKCRPPENRNPEPDEVASCEPFLIRQLELIKPEVIVALGKFAVQTLLRVKTPISQLRGRWFDYHGIRLMPTFHPAYLLRNPGDKRLVWQDIQQVMQALGMEIPKR